MKKKRTVVGLLAANALALGILLATEPASAFGGDFCDEQTAVGCVCIEDVPLNPDGCHEQAAPVNDCPDEGCGLA